MEFMKNFGFLIYIFFRKILHDVPTFFDKSLIHKIKKNLKIYRIFWQVQIGGVENKKVKYNKKNKKKQIVNHKILKKKYISQINSFFKRTFRIFQKLLVKSLILPIKHHKKFHNFWTSLDRRNRKQNAKKAKKIKKK